jgi:hypothetical protein
MITHQGDTADCFYIVIGPDKQATAAVLQTTPDSSEQKEVSVTSYIRNNLISSHSLLYTASSVHACLKYAMLYVHPCRWYICCWYIYPNIYMLPCRLC